MAIEDTPPKGPRPGTDKAAWHRFSANNKDRCEVCGSKAEVSIQITAFEIGGTGRGGSRPKLASNKGLFCDVHGRARFEQTLKGLTGRNVSS